MNLTLTLCVPLRRSVSAHLRRPRLPPIGPGVKCMVRLETTCALEALLVLSELGKSKGYRHDTEPGGIDELTQDAFGRKAHVKVRRFVSPNTQRMVAIFASTISSSRADSFSSSRRS